MLEWAPQKGCYMGKVINKDQLYEAVSKVLAKGNNVEIRRKSDGTWQVLEVKKNIVT